MEQPEWGKNIAKYFIVPQRVILAIMGFIAITCAYATRVCLSVAIIAMVVRKHRPRSKESEMDDEGKYEWSEEHQGLILSSFYWGYLITHLPGGMLADHFGGKWTLSVGVFFSAICSLLSPVAVHSGGSSGLIIVRAIMGGAQGVIYPALSTLVSQWVPPRERSTMGAFIMGGGQVGTIAGNSLSGVLLDAYVWDWTFYFFGIVGVIWFFFFIFLCYSDPFTHPFIKDSEKEYFAREMGRNLRRNDLPPTPWLAIITNAPMIALVFAQIGHDFGFYIMVSDLPKYMGDVLQFSIKESGIFAALPYVGMWVVSLFSGIITDHIIKNNVMTITNARKLMTSIAAFGPAVGIVAASYAGYNKTLVVLLFTLAMASMGTFYAGMKLGPIDMSPNYSGTLMAITNGIGSVTGILAPYYAGLVTPDATLLQWRLVFWSAFAVLVSTCFVYIVWASGEIQPFNDPPEAKKEGA